jgi:phosphate uptake regulator
METRKLQQVGGGTYTVSIPKSWADEHGLEAGNDVHLYTHADGSMVVRGSAKDREGLSNARIDIDGESPSLVVRALRAAYAVGFQTVTLRTADSFSDEQRRAARQAKRHLVGMEVVQEDDDGITLQNLLDASDVSVRQSVVQLQFLALSIHRGATASVFASGGQDYDRLRERAEEAERIVGMITRHFSRSQVSMEEVDRLGVSRPTLFDYYTVALELQGIAKSGVTIVQAGADLDETASIFADLGEVAAAIQRAVEGVATAVLEGGDLAAATASYETFDETQEAIMELDREAVAATDWDDRSPAELRASTRLLDALLETVDHGERIAAVALRRAIRADRPGN